MKKLLSFFLLFVFMLSPVVLPAQEYDLMGMDNATFAAGGDSRWSFERYTYNTGMYNKFAMYSDSSCANYVDIYLPERVGGVWIYGTTLEELGTANGEWTWPNAPKRMAWCDYLRESTSAQRSNKSMFAYVAENVRNLGYEVYATDVSTSVISFTVPADGYYKANLQVIREDNGGNGKPLKIIGRFRFNDAKDINHLDAGSNMGFAFRYGSDNTVVAESGYRLSEGAAQRFIAQQPVDGAFSFYAKAGDIISLEVNVEELGIVSTWARDFWARTFWRGLKYTKVEQAVAEAEPIYLNPYDVVDDTELANLLEEITEFMQTITIDERGYLCYRQAEVDKFNAAITQVLNASATTGGINSMNLQTYIDMLNDVYTIFKASVNTVDWSKKENMDFLFQSTNEFSQKTYKMTDWGLATGVWNYQTYTVATGAYADFSNNAETGPSKVGTPWAWYNNDDYLFIKINGAVHPTVATSPAIVFTAPADGVYQVGATINRPNPNMSQSNTMYARFRFRAAGVNVLEKTSTMGFDVGYGNKSTEPVSSDFFVNMKKGDMITFEEDAYTANTNGSAGSTWSRLQVFLRPDDSEATAGGAKYCNPYAVGDYAKLDSLLTVCNNFYAQAVESPAGEVGKYPAGSKDVFKAVIDEAQAFVTKGSASQLDVDSKYAKLKAALDLFASQIYYETNVFMDGEYYIHVGGYYVADGSTIKENDAPLMQAVRNTETPDQIFHVTHSTPSSESDRFAILSTLTANRNINEGAVFKNSWGSGDHSWRTHNILFNGTAYAIQSAGSGASNGFWIFDPAVPKVVTSKRTSVNAQTDFIFDFISVNQVLTEEAAAGRLAFDKAVVGSGDAEYDEAVYNAFKLALEAAEGVSDDGVATSADLFDYSTAWKLFVPNGNVGIDPVTAKSFNVTAQENAIKIETEKASSVAVYGVSGALLAQANVNGTQSVSVVPGIYIVKILDASGVYAVKVVVK